MNRSSLGTSVARLLFALTVGFALLGGTVADAAQGGLGGGNLAGNLLANADFSSGGMAWTSKITAPATGSIVFPTLAGHPLLSTGSGQFLIDAAGLQNYQAQLYQTVGVTAGNVYLYSFSARKLNTGTRSISFVVETDAAPYDKDVNRSVVIDENWKLFTGSFTATSTRNVRIEIQGGLSNLDFQVDNFFVAPRTNAPVVTAFSVPAQSTSRTVSLTIAASDTTGVTGYLLESWPFGAPVTIETPDAADSRWTATKPTSFTSPDAVGCTLLALFVKDGDANVSEASLTSFCVVDIYEEDDTPATSRAITVNAPPQLRSSHADRNHDWVKIAVTQGAAYTVSVVHQTEFAYAYDQTWGALVSVYDSSDLATPILEARETAPGGVIPTTLHFVAAHSGTYFVRYEGRHFYRLPPNETYTLAVTSPY